MYPAKILEYIKSGQEFTGEPGVNPTMLATMSGLGLMCDRRRGYFPVETGEKYLNVGCGFHHIPGYINIDKDEQFEPDMVCEALDLGNKFEEGTITGIIMIHSLPYLSWWQAEDLMSIYYKLLKPQGKLLLQHCSLENLFNNIGTVDTVDKLLQLMQGLFACDMTLEADRQNYEYAKIIWPSVLLIGTMTHVGFQNIQKIDFAKPFDPGWRDVLIVGGKNDKE